jgi:PD-(D/E)XK nuclease superfamily protein
MSDELVVGGVEVISLFAAAEGERKRKRAGEKTKLAADSAPAVAGRSARPTRSVREMTPKELGEMAEAEFLTRALEMGMAVAKPWGESRGYDFIVDDEGKLCRVQVKAAFSEGTQGSYSLRAYRSSKRSYTKKDIDVMAGYVNPEDAWYFFPVRVIRRLRSLKLFPASKKRRSKHEKWREAWWVVRK